MLETLTPTCAVRFGSSLPDVAHYLRTNRPTWREQHSFSNHPSASWDLNTDYAKAWNIADVGWSEGALRLNDRLNARPAPTTTHAKEQHDVAGYYPDVSRHLAGMPDSMVRKGNPKGYRPIVHIVVNGVANYNITAIELANYGTAMASMVDTLEASGRRVELDIVYCVTGRIRELVGWKVKQANEPLDLASLAFSVAHPAAFRRIGWALMERLPVQYDVSGSGYGTSRSMTEEDASLINADAALLINGVLQSAGLCNTEKGALAYAANQINLAAGETIVEIEQ